MSYKKGDRVMLRSNKEVRIVQYPYTMTHGGQGIMLEPVGGGRQGGIGLGVHIDEVEPYHELDNVMRMKHVVEIPMYDKPEATKSILLEADELVNGERQKAYGDTISCMQRTADIFTAISGKEITAKDVPLFNIAQKLARELNGHKRDNLTDIAGYLDILNRVEEAKQ